MRVVIDTNIIISAIINPKGRELDIIFNYPNIQLFSCYFLHVELIKHKEKLLKLSKLQENEFLELFYYILKQISLMNEEYISSDIWRMAYNYTKEVDEKDISFVALSMSLDAKLWTGDNKLIKGLKKKGFNNIITSTELKNIF